jgi:hypothetical protein
MKFLFKSHNQLSKSTIKFADFASTISNSPITNIIFPTWCSGELTIIVGFAG